MPYYAVLFKTEADDGGRRWPLGPMADRNYAVATFNARERHEGIGEFTLDEISPFLPD